MNIKCDCSTNCTTHALIYLKKNAINCFVWCLGNQGHTCICILYIPRNQVNLSMDTVL